MQPSNDYITAIFTNYVKSKADIMHDMNNNILVHSIVSIDHTFNIAGRIKTHTTSSDGKVTDRFFKCH